MSKRLYNSPKMETAPLYLSACIMSGNGEGSEPDTSNVDTGSGFMAPRKNVF